MPSPIEVIDKKLILPLSVLRTEFGFAFLYFGLLLGIKSSDILDNPWLLGLWGILFLGALIFDLSRPGIHSQFFAQFIAEDTKSPPKAGKRRVALRSFGIALASITFTLLLMNYSGTFFFKAESLFRLIYYGDSLANWILLSIILVVTNLIGALASLRKGEIAPYARLFPILALGIVYLKGII